MNKIKIITLLVFLLITGKTFAQQITIKASVDSTNVLIGDQLKLKFELEQAKNIEVILPSFSDTITSTIEVAQLQAIDTIKTDKPDIIKIIQELTIQSFDTGLQVVPAQIFRIASNNTVDSIKSYPVEFYVHSGFKVDLEKGPSDIKPVYEAPVNLAEVTPYILGLIIIAAIAFFIFYYINYLAKRKANNAENKIVEPAHIIALRELERIKASEAWNKNEKAKEYYGDLSDTLRIYILNRFDINAMEYTTIETIEACEKQKDLINQKNKEQLKSILELSDLVKFAKYKPQVDESERCLNTAFLFIKDTMLFETETKTESSNEEHKNTETEN